MKYMDYKTTLDWNKLDISPIGWMNLQLDNGFMEYPEFMEYPQYL